MLELDHIRVHDAMHQGLLSCDADTPLGAVAAIMVKHRVHAVAVTDGNSARVRGIVSDLDVLRAIAAHDEPNATQAAATEPLAVSSDDRLELAAQLLVEHGVSHLVVVDAADGHPIGVLSTLDVAAVYAHDRAR